MYSGGLYFTSITYYWSCTALPWFHLKMEKKKKTFKNVCNLKYACPLRLTYKTYNFKIQVIVVSDSRTKVLEILYFFKYIIINYRVFPSLGSRRSPILLLVCGDFYNSIREQLHHFHLILVNF